MCWEERIFFLFADRCSFKKVGNCWSVEKLQKDSCDIKNQIWQKKIFEITFMNLTMI